MREAHGTEQVMQTELFCQQILTFTEVLVPLQALTVKLSALAAAAKPFEENGIVQLTVAVPFARA